MATPKGKDRVRAKLIEIEHPETGEPVLVPEFRLLSQKQMAIVTGLSERWFQLQRSEGKGPPFYRCTGGQVRYCWPHWQKWLESMERHSSNDYQELVDEMRLGTDPEMIGVDPRTVTD